jgi:GNAT superfamily N-acetyltransferase
VSVVAVVDPVERSRICESVLRSLPEWFGIEEATAAYVRDVVGLPTFAVGDDALLTLKTHFPRAAEIYLLAVRAGLHRQGLGQALIAAAEDHLRGHGVEFLQVKTLGPSDPDESYARTRAFYEAVGFAPLEELHDLWGANPALIMVKRL